MQGHLGKHWVSQEAEGVGESTGKSFYRGFHGKTKAGSAGLGLTSLNNFSGPWGSGAGCLGLALGVTGVEK